MAKKKLSQFKRHVGKHTYTKTISSTESLRFKTPNGKFTKFDGRKKLIIEVYNKENKKTGRVLNRVKKGLPVPQKFNARIIKKKILRSKVAKQGPRQAATINSKEINIDAHYTIIDNIEAKCPEMIKDIIDFTKRKNAAQVQIDFYLKEISKKDNTVLKSENITINSVIRSQSPTYISLELASDIIGRMYRNERRMSNIKKSSRPKHAYTRSIKTKFTWSETKRVETF